MNQSIRLNKFIAHAGIASRRKADELITAGKVKVNNKTTTKLGSTIDPTIDTVLVNGKVINPQPQIITYAVYKPRGYISTVADELGRPSVISLVPQDIKLYPAGRLDAESEGLIILTNDGDLAYRLTHPKYHISKTYQIITDRQLTRPELHQIRQGLQLKHYKSAPAQIDQIDSEEGSYAYQIVLHQGKNRQIRRMMAALNTNVKQLTRTGIGQFHIQTLAGEQYLKLNSNQIKQLLNRN